MKQRSPEQIIKLYDWLWRRAAKGTMGQHFSQMKPLTLTGRCIVLLGLQRARIHEAMKSRVYREDVSKIIHSN